MVLRSWRDILQICRLFVVWAVTVALGISAGGPELRANGALYPSAFCILTLLGSFLFGALGDIKRVDWQSQVGATGGSQGLQVAALNPASNKT